MNPFLDQIFVNIKRNILEIISTYAPEWVVVVVSHLLSISAIIIVFALMFGVVTVIERKLLGRIQNRYGPNRVGPYGFFQFIADGIKTLTKEDVVPYRADRVVHFLAPIVMVVPVMLTFSVIPYGRNMTPVEIDSSLFFYFAIGAATELAVFMAGWSSRNKYSLLGAMRGVAQMLSYEIPLIISAISVVMISGSLSTTQIVNSQSGYSLGFVPKWYIFTPWGFACFLLFMIAVTAELNRSPFDLPEGESEIIAGYYIEYSGFKFALFFLGEYFGMFAACGIATTLFLGGWNAPLPFLEVLPSWFWFFAKLFLLVFIFIWVRGTLPRLRMDQLMDFSWTFLLPLSLITLVSTGLWHFLKGNLIASVICSAIIITSYIALARRRQPNPESLT